MAKKPEKQTFEKALEKLERIVSEMEEGKMSLDDMLGKFEDGMKLARFCSKQLESAEKKVDVLVKKQDGEKVLEPFETPESEAEDETTED